MSEAVGLVGLGQMGTPISTNLIRVGYTVAGYDIDPARVRALGETGGKVCDSPSQVAEEAAVVITSLPSAAALEAALGGDGGLLSAQRTDELVIIETSTLALDDKNAALRAVVEAGSVLLDCPLSGTAGQAQSKDLVVYASGDEPSVRRCAPIFEGFARAHYYLGEFGAGSKMKFIANLLVAIHNVAAAEAFVLAQKAGMDPETVYEVIGDSAAMSRMFQVRGPMMVAGDYDRPGMPIRLFQKDLGIIAEFARSCECPTPLFTAGSQLYLTALAHGLGEQDAAAVCAALERVAGAERGR